MKTMGKCARRSILLCIQAFFNFNEIDETNCKLVQGRSGQRNIGDRNL